MLQAQTVNSQDEYDHSIKIVLVGDISVGKTCILAKYIHEKIPKSPIPTIGVELQTKIIELNNGTRIKAQIWDTAGQERYRALTSKYNINFQQMLKFSHFKRAVGALLIYDITKEQSFKNIDKWYQDLKMEAGNDIVIMLVGNKRDVKYQQINSVIRQVDFQEAENYSKKNKMFFMEVSAVTGYNIKQCFQQLLEGITQIYQLMVKEINKQQHEKKIEGETSQMRLLITQNETKSESCAC